MLLDHRDFVVGQRGQCPGGAVGDGGCSTSTTPDAGEQLLQLSGVFRQLGDEDLAGRLHIVFVGVLEHNLDEFGEGHIEFFVHNPAAHTADATTTNDELLHSGRELVVGYTKDVRVDVVGENNGALGECRVHGAKLVAVPRRGFVVEFCRGRLHLFGDEGGVTAIVARHKRGEIERNGLVLFFSHPSDAGRGALADVPEQAGPARLRGAFVGGVGAAPHGEDLEHQVDGLADGPDLGVRAKVACALEVAVAGDQHPRHLVLQGDRQIGVRLVVAELHVEGRVEFFDPRELELERLKFGAHHRPRDGRRRQHHPARALVQGVQRSEIVRQAGPKVFRLPYIEHPTRGVTEPVHAGGGGDFTRGGSPAHCVGHLGCSSPCRGIECRCAGDQT